MKFFGDWHSFTWKRALILMRRKLRSVHVADEQTQKNIQSSDVKTIPMNRERGLGVLQTLQLDYQSKGCSKEF